VHNIFELVIQDGDAIYKILHIQGGGIDWANNFRCFDKLNKRTFSIERFVYSTRYKLIKGKTNHEKSHTGKEGQ